MHAIQSNRVLLLKNVDSALQSDDLAVSIDLVFIF